MSEHRPKPSATQALSPLDKILSALPHAKRDGSGWRSPCPGPQHEHGNRRNPALSISEGREGEVLLYCHAGCSVEDILGAIGLQKRDLYPPREPASRPRMERRRPKAVAKPARKPGPLPSGKSFTNYIYKDGSGAEVIAVVREDIGPKEKRIRQYHHAGGGWLPGLGDWRDRPRPLYRLDAIQENPDAPIIVHEGEKAVEAARAAGLTGVHTTTIGGAGNAHKSDFSPMAGREVYVCPDADEPGERHAEQVAALAYQAGASVVHILQLPDIPEKGDVVEFLEAGGTPDAWRGLMESAEVMDIPASEDDEDDRPSLPPEVVDLLARSTIPASYEVDASGTHQVQVVKESVVKDEDGKPVLDSEGKPVTEQLTERVSITTKPIFVEAVCRGEDGQDFGFLTHWLDLDNQLHSWAIPAYRLDEMGNGLIQDLRSQGVPLLPRAGKSLIDFLTYSYLAVRGRRTAVTKTGWHGSVYVLPREVIGEGAEGYVYQPHELTLDDSVRQGGTFEDWKAGVAEVSPIIRFAISASLASVLIAKTSVQSGGFHFWGQTSRGKTTLLQYAASVWGCSADPANAGEESCYVQQWNSTANAIEATAACCNDRALILDEIGASSGDFGQTIYRLMSGAGKARSTKSGGLAKRRSWRLLLLSNGEQKVSERLAEQGRGSKGGQHIRLIDIPAEGIFSSAQEADAAKIFLQQHYGHAGPAFVRWVIEQGDAIRERWHAFDAETIGKADRPEAARVRERFRLVAFAGECAIEAGVLPWERGTVLEVVRHFYTAWAGDGLQDDIERGIANVRSFILQNLARFETPQSETTPPHCAGVIRSNPDNEDEKIFYFEPMVFDTEACGGVSPDIVKRALAERGLLRREGRKFTCRIRWNGRRPETVAVRGAILDFDADEGVSLHRDNVGTHVGTPQVIENKGVSLRPYMSLQENKITFSQPDSPCPGVPTSPKNQGSSPHVGTCRDSRDNPIKSRTYSVPTTENHVGTCRDREVYYNDEGVEVDEDGFELF